MDIVLFMVWLFAALMLVGASPQIALLIAGVLSIFIDKGLEL